jgi:predicted TIM-barrel fold metal-dependent hydrolase
MSSTTTPSLDWMISVDDHVLEPPKVWQDRVPARFREAAPRLITTGEGEFWKYEDRLVPTGGLAACAGKGPDFFTPDAITYADMLPGCYDVASRVRDMDLAGILASMSFPSFPRFCGQIFHEAKDKQLALLCVQAYNDWMIDEWCAEAGKNILIPLTIVPLWDAQLAADEIRRCAAKGSHAVAFTENPFHLGLPSMHDKSRWWDPFLQACEETDTVINMHIGSSSKMPSTSPDSPFIVSSILTFQNAMGSMIDWIISGTFARFPALRIAYSEGQAGWVPYVLERADKLWEERVADEAFGSTLPNPPSSYVPGHVWFCLFDDEVGLLNRDIIGMDQLTFEVDYPHADSTFPHTEETANKIVQKAGLSEAESYKLLRGNAIELYHLDKYCGISV